MHMSKTVCLELLHLEQWGLCDHAGLHVLNRRCTNLKQLTL